MAESLIGPIALFIFGIFVCFAVFGDFMRDVSNLILMLRRIGSMIHIEIFLDTQFQLHDIDKQDQKAFTTLYTNNIRVPHKMVKNHQNKQQITFNTSYSQKKIIKHNKEKSVLLTAKKDPDIKNNDITNTKLKDKIAEKMVILTAEKGTNTNHNDICTITAEMDDIEETDCKDNHSESEPEPEPEPEPISNNQLSDNDVIPTELTDIKQAVPNNFNVDTVAAPVQLSPPIQSNIITNSCNDIQEEIEEEKKENMEPLYTYSSINGVSIVDKTKYIFIPAEFTSIYYNKLIECFNDSTELFYYLRYTFIMQLIDNQCKVYNDSILLFNTELHQQSTRSITNLSILYAVLYKNDRIAQQKWKMIKLLTSSEILIEFGIKLDDLPSGSRKLRDLVNMSAVIDKECICNNISINKYACLNQIPSPQQDKLHKIKPNVYMIHNNLFHSLIIAEISSPNNKLIPQISFNVDKSNYCIQYALPIRLLNSNNWIAILFRCVKTKLIPQSISINCHDIRNKSLLFRAANIPKIYNWLNNNITKFVIKDIDELFDQQQIRTQQALDLNQYLLNLLQSMLTTNN